MAVGASLVVAVIAVIAVVGGGVLIGQSTRNQPNAAATASALAQTSATAQSGLVKLSAPATWPILKNDLRGMTYMGDDAFATWTSSLENGILNYQMFAKTAAAYPVPISGSGVSQMFHYAVSAKQVSGPPSASYGLLMLYPFGARAADASTGYYQFVIDNNSNARFALRKDGVWKTLWQSFALSAVKPNETNAFVVHAESNPGGTLFTLFLNGRYVADVVDNQLARPGAVGVMMVLDNAGDAASWEFSNPELRAPPASP